MAGIKSKFRKLTPLTYDWESIRQPLPPFRWIEAIPGALHCALHEKYIFPCSERLERITVHQQAKSQSMQSN